MIRFERLSQQPILVPTNNWWESKAVFNPGATVFNGKIVLLYRAVGGDNLSRFGLATSSDGVNFERSKEPVFEADFKNPDERLGVEDPRIVKFGNEFLITYTGVSVYPLEQMSELTWQRKAPWKIRTFLTRTEDFVNFSHEELILDFDTKDTALFPEKIAGKYVLLHRIFPNLSIIYSSDLKNWYGIKQILKTRAGSWDSSRLGGGCPPIRTKLGWLHFYHGVDDKDTYRIGVLIHDINDPEKVLYRSNEPILSPELSWEKVGNFPNVVFSCGAVEKNGQYLIYYGAADKVIGVAVVDKEKLLHGLEEELEA